MAHRSSRQMTALIAAVVAIGVALPAHGVLPLIAGLGKQIVQNMLIDGVKSQLIGSLSGMGCKGAALASLVASSSARGMGGMLGGGMLPGLAGGRAMPPGIAVMPSDAMPSGAMPNMADARTMRAARGAPEIPNLASGADLQSMDLSKMMALMQQQMGSRVGAMPSMSPEQMAMLQSSMAAMQQAMSQPLSRAETQAVFDELAELGVMTPDMQSEARDCVTLAPASADASLGMSAALIKSMVLPQLRSAREQMAHLQPEDRERLASEIAQAMKDASPEDRKAFQEGFAAGFFPPDVVDSVQARLR